MPSLNACPIPEVDRALTPYINSNQNTLRIRKSLSRYLSAHVKPAKVTPPQHLDLGCPDTETVVHSNTSALKHSRLRYLQALEARHKAEARQRELQESLDELQQHHFRETPVQDDLSYDKEATQGYIDLLNQRRRFSELEVIQEALERLLNANPVNGQIDHRRLVKEKVGEQPDPPVERLDQLSRNGDNDTSLFKLKKEVLEAKASMDRAKTAKADAQSQSSKSATLQQQVHALSCARDEMVAWMEGELAKMNEESMLLEDASPVKQWPQDRVIVDVMSSEQPIRDTYDSYTTSRSSMIKAHDFIQEPVSVGESAMGLFSDAPAPSNGPETTMSNRTITDILPHIPRLNQTAKSERSLLQQAVYLQAQLSSADGETTESLVRLSEESHLLPSGSQGVTGWAMTAMQAESTTEEAVLRQLNDSHYKVNSVKAIIDLCSQQSRILAST